MKNKITIISGDIATGKTTLGLELAMSKVSYSHNNIIYVKPETHITGNMEVGFLPQSKEDKDMAFHLTTNRLLNYIQVDMNMKVPIKKAFNLSYTDLYSICYTKDIDSAVIVIDEIQLISDIKSTLQITRLLDSKAKLILIGDINQSQENYNVLTVLLEDKIEGASYIELKKKIRRKRSDLAFSFED